MEAPPRLAGNHSATQALSPSRRGVWAAAALLSLGVMLLSGCGEGSVQRALDDYAAAVAAALPDTAASTVTKPSSTPRYPDRRELRLTVPDLMIGFGDFLEITNRCGLGPMVAERNSAMGKLMPDSRRLAYEQTLYARLADCRDQPSQSEDPEVAVFAHRLAAIVERKRAELPRVYWNATFAGPEMADLFSASRGRRGWTPGDGSLDRVLDAMAYLTQVYQRLGDPDRLIDVSGLESNLAVLREAYGARLLTTLVSSIMVLEQTADALASAGTLACDGVAELLRVGAGEDVRRLADQLARLTADGELFLNALESLALAPRAPAPAAPFAEMPAFQGFYHTVLKWRGPDSLWSRYLRARERHQSAWRGVEAADCRV